ncbi:MAG: hypothetical protein NZ949_04820, partial [Candidatus Kapabacteria bacterium]|nr:hypothetical protein [Candidatus Kapabacteria bacterium]MDW7996576.1 DUF4149 domain-containing protein [Bacteroidota bacterium]
MSQGRLFASLLAFYGGIMLWVGSWLIFGGVIAGIPFAVLPRDSAGTVNRLILGRLHLVELVGIVLLGVALWLLNLRIQGWQWRVSLVGFVVMLTLFGVYAGLIEPMMNAIARSVSFEDSTLETSAAVARFEGYHRV